MPNKEEYTNLVFQHSRKSIFLLQVTRMVLFAEFNLPLQAEIEDKSEYQQLSALHINKRIEEN